MGNKIFEIKLKPGYSDDELERKIGKLSGIKSPEYFLIKKSLDARKKDNLYYNIRVCVKSDNYKTEEFQLPPILQIPKKGKKRKVTIVGLGPAGFFSAYILQLAGFDVTIIEQGRDVRNRVKDITKFENERVLDEKSNYSFGEGGAGTFSDGKLTSRTKTIDLERNFIYDTFIKAGAPEEILYLTHPHLGTDQLRLMSEKMRSLFEDVGGKILFSTTFEDFLEIEKSITKVFINSGDIETDFLILATGHSNYNTYSRMIKRGVPFRVKPFAIGMRAEHEREIINRAQWGVDNLPDFKAAEYRLTAQVRDNASVFSFCMCPGGKIVPVTPYKDTNIVNGMSVYKRNAPFSNAAVVAPVDLRKILGEKCDPLHAIEWLHQLEKKFYTYTNSFDIPAIRIDDFLKSGKSSGKLNKSSFPFGLKPMESLEIMPDFVVDDLKLGLNIFCQKLKGYENGMLLGLESKTSSPIQVIRNSNGKVEGFNNLYYCGEGSGYSGGIISSAADGIKTAMTILNLKA
ncbi:MAG: FAD-dependent oxidoreductase [Candidatus Delongbacteria bacterium]|nr:FAD-dependent oxidoreductase [Candidatus Delongbacteria bacterium]MBN2836570.1 FAD-dependent oxidoreductase [Candidatus Delongbacteria bacterium]